MEILRKRLTILPKKNIYIQHLKAVGGETLLVSLCDKLHNAKAIVADVKIDGVKVWGRFNANPKEISWYYQSLLKVFQKRANELGSKGHSLILQFQESVRNLVDLSIKIPG